LQFDRASNAAPFARQKAQLRLKIDAHQLKISDHLRRTVIHEASSSSVAAPTQSLKGILTLKGT
jgi:hypothetical protein